MTRAIVVWGVVASLLFRVVEAFPDDSAAAPSRPVPATVAAAADDVTRLADAHDAAGLVALASALQLDPWRVADELCARGAFDAADSYARAAPATRRGGVAAFVAGQRRDPTDPSRRKAMSDAYAARVAGRPAEGLAIIDGAGPARDDVVSVRLLHERALETEAMGGKEAAIRALTALLDKVRRMDWPDREASLCEYVAPMAEALADRELAERMWRRAFELYARFPSPADEGRVLHRLATLQFSQDRVADSLATMRRALATLDRAGDATTLGRATSALACYEDAAGDLAGAMAHHDEALALLGSSTDADDRVRGALNASRTLYRLNDLRGAIALAEHALADPVYSSSTPGARVPPQLLALRGLVLLNRAEYRSAGGDLDAASADLDAAALAFSAAGDRQWSARAEGQRATVMMLRDYAAGAQSGFERTLAIADSLGDRNLCAVAREGLACLARRNGDLDGAVLLWEAAVLDARASGSARVESECVRSIVEAELHLGADREALLRAREAVALDRRAAQRLATDEATAFAASVRAAWELGLIAARRLGDVGAWFEMAESGRANALAESVGGRAAIQVAAVSEALTAEAETALAELAAATDESTKARATGALAASRAAAARETAARERVRVVQDRIERGKKRAARLDAPTPPTLQEVRALVGKGRALVVFHVGEQTSDALVVAADGARLVDLGATPAFVAQCDAVRAGDATAEAVAAAKAAIVEKLGIAKEVRTLLVVPDGPVATVPFALLDPGRDVAIVPSALVWTLLDLERDQRGAGVLAVGDPDYAGTRLAALPATRAEAEAVGTKVLVGKDATEDSVRRALVECPRWHAVHFACHGVIDPRAASLSGLALTRAGSDDGTFTAREILGLPVPADVVVLSACEAGRPGAQSAATGIPPAFLAAGSPRVVANLWKVDDEAGRVFSVAFHKAWSREGVTAASALREARDAVRADPRFAAPRHWAGWVLWGLPD